MACANIVRRRRSGDVATDPVGAREADAMSGPVVHAHQIVGVTKHPLRGARLTFYIKEGLIVGHAGGKHVQISAWSGGGGGSKTGWLQKDVVNQPDKVSQKTTGGHNDHKHHHHGGPIPPGQYTIRTPDGSHPNLGPISAALIPAKQNQMFHRGGFFIHGRGPHGSDGCIVPHTSTQFHALMAALKHDHGGHLTVVASK
jgi:hypothetical protein